MITWKLVEQSSPYGKYAVVNERGDGVQSIIHQGHDIEVAALISAAHELYNVAVGTVVALCVENCDTDGNVREDHTCRCDDRYGYLKAARVALAKADRKRV